MFFSEITGFKQETFFSWSIKINLISDYDIKINSKFKYFFL